MQSNKQTKAKKTQSKKNNKRNKKYQNSMIPVAVRVDRPKTRVAKISASNGAVVVTHREYFDEIELGATDFSITSYRINAANANMFPWLSNMARGFESYLFRKLSFHYVPACPTTTSGMAMLAIEYDPLDPTPTNKIELLAMHGAKPDNIFHESRISLDNVDSKTLGVRRFTLANDEFSAESVVYPPSGDPKTYDLGYFNAARTATSGAGAAGDLWVEYTVELFTPQLNSIGPYDGAAKVSHGGGDTSRTNLFGSAATIIGNGLREQAVKYASNALMIPLRRGAQQLFEMNCNAAGSMAGYTPVVSVVDEITGAAAGSAAARVIAGGNNYLNTTYAVWSDSALSDKPMLRFDTSASPYDLTNGYGRITAFPYSWA